MSHYAKIDQGKVLQVVVAEPEFFQTFVDSSPGAWLQCSYNTRGGTHYGPDGQPDGGIALRKNYPGIGWNYDYSADAFYPPCSFPSWTLNKETFLWDPPVSYPDDGKIYKWEEISKEWKEVV